MNEEQSKPGEEWQRNPEGGWTRIPSSEKSQLADDLRALQRDSEGTIPTTERSSEWVRDGNGGWIRAEQVESGAATERAETQIEAQRIAANRELLQGQETNAELLLRAYDAAITRFPELAQVVIIASSENSPRANARHQFNENNQTGQPEVSLNLQPGAEELLESFATEHPVSWQRLSELMNLSPDAMTTQHVQAFVLLHELGHALDYGKTIDSPEDAERRKEHRKQEMDSLPIPGVPTLTLSNPVYQEKLLELNPDLFQNISQKYQVRIESMQDLINLQESMYRNLPSERYADEFAGAVMTGRPFELSATKL